MASTVDSIIEGKIGGATNGFLSDLQKSSTQIEKILKHTEK